MKAAVSLNIIKGIHTFIWLVFVMIISFVSWSGISGNINLYSWLAVTAVLIEGLVLVISKGRCPLTVLAAKYSNSSKENFDIFLPLWLAKYNKQIFGTVFACSFILVLLHYSYPRLILIYIVVFILSIFFILAVIAIPATLSLRPGVRQDVPLMDINEAARLVKHSGKYGWELAGYATLLVHKRMMYSRRNSFDGFKKAFRRGYGYCQQQAFALQYILRQAGVDAWVVHSLKNKFPTGAIGSHAWVRVRFENMTRNYCAVFPDSVTGEATFIILGKVHNYTPLFRFFSGWGSIGINAIRYYKTGKDF